MSYRACSRRRLATLVPPRIRVVLLPVVRAALVAHPRAARPPVALATRVRLKIPAQRPPVVLRHVEPRPVARVVPATRATRATLVPRAILAPHRRVAPATRVEQVAAVPN